MRAILTLVCGLLLLAAAVSAQNWIPTNDPGYYGPFNGVFWPDGDALKKFLVKDDTVTRADSPWTVYAWVWLDEASKGPTLIAGIGNPEDEYSRYLGIDGDKLILWAGKDNILSGAAALTPRKWHFLAASFDGRNFHLSAEGIPIADGKLDLGTVSGVPEMAPLPLPWPEGKHFSGKLATLTVFRHALTADELKGLAEKPANFSVLLFEEASKPWPVQTYAQAGYRGPQDPATLPHSKAPFSKPEKKSVSPASKSLEATGKNEWTLGAWKLRPTPDVLEPAEAISHPEFSVREWWTATVPGTGLTTMVDQGIYPDPDYGLNNLAIPETLNKQDYWYRTEFTAANDWKGRHITLTFEGINYAASVWLNAKQLGTMKGAFVRGVFDLTGAIKLGQTSVLAGRVSPPPHPGIPHEQSIKAGAGENGGLMCLDGPTFVDTEGWAWTGVTEAFNLGLAPQLKGNVVLVKLELRGSGGTLLSDNFCWLGGDSADYRKLNHLPMAQLAVTTSAAHEKDLVKIHVRLGTTAAIETKFTLLENDGATRVLPAYYGDNYVSLLPGECREIESPASSVKGGLTLGLRGWNVSEKVVKVGGEK